MTVPSRSQPRPSPIATLFGLPAHQGRWLLIPLGILLLLCLGTVYSWSLFRAPLEQELGLSATESLLPYTLALVCYATWMPITGLYLARWGTRPTTAVGGLVVGLGYLLASAAPSIGWLTLAYGGIAGTGVGIAYGVPMAVMARWFPDRKGLAVGLTIIGFGLSPLVTAPVAQALITTWGVRPALASLGIAFAILSLAIATTLKLPPPTWQASLSPELTQGQGVGLPRPPYSPHLLKSRAFYGLWLCYAIATLVGLSAIGISSPVGQEVIGLSPDRAAQGVALFALFNGLSRPLFGWLSDRYAPHRVAIAAYGLIFLAAGLMTQAQPGQAGIYFIAFCLFWFCLGGWLAIAPTTTLRFFNPDDYARNYGLVFTAYGVGALLGTLATGQLRDWFGSYTYGFYGMAALALVGMAIAATLLKANSPD